MSVRVNTAAISNSFRIKTPEIHPEVAIGHAGLELGNVDPRFSSDTEVINSRAALRAVLPPMNECFVIKPQSSTHMVNVDTDDARILPPNGFSETDVVCDALVTTRRRVGLMLNPADCIPLVVADPGRSLLAMVHLGWRGILGGLHNTVLEYMEREYDFDPGRAVAFIGPSIQQPSYAWHTLPAQVEKDMGAWEQFLEKRGTNFHPDFPGFVTAALTRYGLSRSSITEDPTDVGREGSRHFSLTRHVKHGAPRGRNGVVAVLSS